MSSPISHLETNRLLLRELRSSDEGKIFELRSSPDVNKWLDRNPAKNPDDAERFVNAIIESYKKQDKFYWVIEEKNSSELIGTICLFNIDPEGKSAETGFELLPSATHKGFMQEALDAVLEFAFTDLKLKMITAVVHRENERSISLLQRNWFVSSTNVSDPAQPLKLFTLLRETYFS